MSGSQTSLDSGRTASNVSYTGWSAENKHKELFNPSQTTLVVLACQRRACLNSSDKARGQQALQGEGDPWPVQGLYLQAAQQGCCCQLNSPMCLLHTIHPLTTLPPFLTYFLGHVMASRHGS